MLPIVILIVVALAILAVQAANTYILKFVLLIRSEEGPENVMHGWEVLSHGWPFMVLGAVLALLVIPLMRQGYQAAHHADLIRATNKADERAAQANERAWAAKGEADTAAKSEYAQRFAELGIREVAHQSAVNEFENERDDLEATVDHFKVELARATEKAEIAEKAKNNAMAAATRQRKKLQKLEARLEQMSKDDKAEDH